MAGSLFLAVYLIQEDHLCSFTRYGYKDMKISQMNYELTIPQHPSSIIRPRKQNVKLTLTQDFIALNLNLILIRSMNYYSTLNRIL